MCRHRDCQEIGAPRACLVLKDWRAQKALRAIWAIEARPHSPFVRPLTLVSAQHSALRPICSRWRRCGCLLAWAPPAAFEPRSSRVRALGAASVFAFGWWSAKQPGQVRRVSEGREGGEDRRGRMLESSPPTSGRMDRMDPQAWLDSTASRGSRARPARVARQA
jgi:hypothetical protein